MATKKKTDQGAAEAAPHKGMPHGLIERAVPGDRAALAQAFGQASGWLKIGEAPPKELCEWLGVRLEALANVLLDPRDKKLAGVNHALGIVEKGKRGRKAAGERDVGLSRFLVWDCYYARRMHPDLTWEQVFEKVAGLAALGGVHISPAKVEDAWKDRRELAPEIPELNP